MNILFTGHSHLTALETAAEHQDFPEINPSFLQLTIPEYTPIVSDGQAPEVHPAFKSDIRERVQNRDLIICLAYGNEHNILALLNHPQPFDFTLKSEKTLPLLDTRQIIPAAFIEQRFRAMTVKARCLLEDIRKATPEATPVYQLQSPPPIPSDAHIEKFPGPFRTKMAELGISPVLLRYKLWRAYSAIVEDICQNTGIIYLKAPENTQDKDGYLRQEYWNNDPTHGNEAYGAAVIRNIISVTSKPEPAA